MSDLDKLNIKDSFSSSLEDGMEDSADSELRELRQQIDAIPNKFSNQKEIQEGTNKFNVSQIKKNPYNPTEESIGTYNEDFEQDSQGSHIQLKQTLTNSKKNEKFTVHEQFQKLEAMVDQLDQLDSSIQSDVSKQSQKQVASGVANKINMKEQAQKEEIEDEYLEQDFEQSSNQSGKIVLTQNRPSQEPKNFTIHENFKQIENMLNQLDQNFSDSSQQIQSEDELYDQDFEAPQEQIIQQKPAAIVQKKSSQISQEGGIDESIQNSIDQSIKSEQKSDEKYNQSFEQISEKSNKENQKDDNQQQFRVVTQPQPIKDNKQPISNNQKVQPGISSSNLKRDSPPQNQNNAPVSPPKVTSKQNNSSNLNNSNNNIKPVSKDVTSNSKTNVVSKPINDLNKNQQVAPTNTRPQTAIVPQNNQNQGDLKNQQLKPLDTKKPVPKQNNFVKAEVQKPKEVQAKQNEIKDKNQPIRPASANIKGNEKWNNIVQQQIQDPKQTAEQQQEPEKPKFQSKLAAQIEQKKRNQIIEKSQSKSQSRQRSRSKDIVQKIKPVIAPVVNRQTDEQSYIDNFFEEQKLDTGDRAIAVAFELKNQILSQSIRVDTPPKIDPHTEIVNQIMKRHEQKQKKLKEKEDMLYLRDAMEQMKPKYVKQNLNYQDREKGWIDPRSPLKAQKQPEQVPDNQVVAEKKMVQIGTKFRQVKTQEELEKEKKEKTWQVPVGQGVQTVKEEKEKKTEQTELKRQTDGMLEQKQREHEKMKRLKEQFQALDKKAKELTQMNEDINKKENPLAQKLDVDKDKGQKKPTVEELDQIKQQEERDEIELRRLQVQYRQLIEENGDIKEAMEKIDLENRKAQTEIDDIQRKNGVVILGKNKFTSFGLIPAVQSDKQLTKASEDEDNEGNEGSGDEVEKSNILDKLDDEDNRAVTEMTLVERVVAQIYEQGLDLGAVFVLLDDDGDGVLTMQEVRKQIIKLDLKLDKDEIEQIISILDKNSDGVVNEFEFTGALESALMTQKQYAAVMGELKDISNPIILQERKLDLDLRKKIVNKKIIEEQQKEKNQKSIYEQTIRQLKKQQELQKNREAKKKKPNFEALGMQIENLKVELREIEDDNDQMKMMHEERKEQIEINILELTDELMIQCEEVIKAKRILEEEKNEFYKLEMKLIAYDRMKKRIEKEMAERAENEKELAKKHLIHGRNRNKLLVKAKEDKMDKMKMLNAVMVLQKIFRGWKARTQAKIQAFRMRCAISRIAKFWRIYQLKRKTKILHKLLQQQFQQRVKYGLKAIQQFSLRKVIRGNDQENEEEEKDQFQYIMDENSNQKVKTQKVQKDDSNGQLVTAALTLQKQYRTWQKKRPDLNQITAISLGDDAKDCALCNIKPCEILCKGCTDISYFCSDCYKKYHKSFQRKNHRFFNISVASGATGGGKDKAQTYISTIQRQEEYLQQIILEVGNDIPMIRDKISNEDIGETYLVLDEQIIQLFQQYPSSYQIITSILNEYKESSQKARETYEKNQVIRCYEAKKTYVDYQQFFDDIYDMKKTIEDRKVNTDSVQQ